MDQNTSCSTHTAHGLKKTKVGVWTIFFMIFCMTAAGAYGIEDMIPASGPGMTLVLLLVLPFIWSIPLGLIAAELGSAIPEEGGYYKWIQRALGEFWGFQAGWWRTLSIYVDSTVYIVLAVAYLATFIDMSPTTTYLVKVAIIVFFTYINVRGVKDVGRLAIFFSLIVCAAFVIITILGFINWQYNPVMPFIPEGETVWSSIGLGIAIGMWMYAGYESMSTMAGELEDPQVIPKATLMSVPAIIAVYFFPTLTGLASVGQWEKWGTDGGINFADMASLGGGMALSLLFVVAAFASNLSMYNSYLASGSRGFFAISDDNLAPRFLKHISKKHGTPNVAIYTMAVVNLVLCQFDFSQLVVIDVFLLMFAYILIYISAIVLRIKEPELHRPFKIRTGTAGVVFMSIAPMLIATWALFSNGADYLFWGMIAAVTGPIAYCIFRWVYGGMTKHDKVKYPLNLKTKLGLYDTKHLSISFILFTILAGVGYLYLQMTGEGGIYVTYLKIAIPVFALIAAGTLIWSQKVEPKGKGDEAQAAA